MQQNKNIDGPSSRIIISITSFFFLKQNIGNSSGRLYFKVLEERL